MAQLKSTIIQGALTVTGNVVANKLIKTGGTANQILMADGSTLDKTSVGTGTVTSVGISSSNLTISGSPITSNGTITINHPTTTATTAGAYLVGKDALGHVVLGNKLTPSDLGLSNVYQYKGTVANYASLPTSNLVAGYVYNVTDTGMNYAWTGSAWDALGWIVDLSPYLTAESDTLQTVTTRGATTDKAITTAGLTTTSTLYVTGTTGHREGIRIAPYSGTLSSIWWNASGTQDYSTGQMWGITAYMPTYSTDATKQNTFRFRGPASATATSATDQMWINTAGLVTSRGGFAKSGSSDSYILLAGGGTKALSELATNGSLDNYLPLTGGTMTGAIERHYTAASTDPVLKIASDNFDINIFKVYSGDQTYKNTGVYGYNLVYNGTGSGVANNLTLNCDNQNATTQVIGWQLNQAGQMGIGTSASTSYRLTVNGSANATTLYENGTSLANKYAAKSHNHDDVYLKAENDTLQTVTNRGATTTKTITALSYSVNSNSTIQYNTTEGCLEFVFA